MIRLPLRVKVGLWSAFCAGATIAGALIGIRMFISAEMMDGLDQRLTREAQVFFQRFDHLNAKSADSLAEIAEDSLPPSANNLLVEIYSNDQTLLHRSNALKGQTLGDGTSERHEIMLGNRRFLVASAYHKTVTLVLGVPLGGYYTTLHRLDVAMLVALPIVILLSLAGGLWVARRALRPVQVITEVARRISAEGLNQRLPLPAARDEIWKLTVVLNETFARLETSYQQAIHFASDASHQLKTPITVMRAGIETLMKQPGQSPGNLLELSDLLQQTRRLSSLAEGLLLLARADAGRLGLEPQATDLVQVIEGCMEDAEILAESRQLQIERDLPAQLPAFVDQQRFEQALLNLLENAVKYNRLGGHIRVSARATIGGISVVVANTGKPIPAGKIPVIFHRFSRGETDESLAGHGLGLAIAHELVRAQGGELRLVRSDSELTEFEIRMPALSTPAPQQPAQLALA